MTLAPMPPILPTVAQVMVVAGYAINHGDGEAINIGHTKSPYWLGPQEKIGHAVYIIRKGSVLTHTTSAEVGDVLLKYIYPREGCPWPSYKVAQVVRQ
jgi:hypothetical protein